MSCVLLQRLLCLIALAAGAWGWSRNCTLSSRPEYCCGTGCPGACEASYWWGSPDATLMTAKGGACGECGNGCPSGCDSCKCHDSGYSFCTKKDCWRCACLPFCDIPLGMDFDGHDFKCKAGFVREGDDCRLDPDFDPSSPVPDLVDEPYTDLGKASTTTASLDGPQLEDSDVHSGDSDLPPTEESDTSLSSRRAAWLCLSAAACLAILWQNVAG